MSSVGLDVAADSFVAKFGKRGDLRQAVGETGRIHLDRRLPFLILNRSTDPGTSIARRVAVNSSAYLIWSPEDDEAAAQAFAVVARSLEEHFGALLVIHVSDGKWEQPLEGSEHLPDFAFRIGASPDLGAQRTLTCLAEALSAVRVDLRQPVVEIAKPVHAPLPLPEGEGRFSLMSVLVPQIHRAGPSTFYPQLTHDLSVAIGDALLKAACEFAEDCGEPLAHYRSLGRSAFLAAALDADRKLDRVARSFDFLLSVTPINSHEAMEQFFADGADKEPEFHYRPLTVDPDIAKRDLYNVDLAILEDSLLQRLLSEKRQEIDHQLTMLATRNTPAFKAASLLHYGTAGSQLVADAQSILSRPPPGPSRAERVGATEVAEAARVLVAQYKSVDESFSPAIEIREDVTSLLVSSGKLLIPSTTRMLRTRVDALLAHEVSIHLLTYYNGGTQGLTVFRTGLANYEGLQEGLAVFAEWAVGGLSVARLRLLAARVIGVDAMLDGAGFIDVYRLLTGEHGMSQRSAFEVAVRIFRSGGFAKDKIYLQGFQDVIGIIASGQSLEPFWIGKIAPEHVDAIEELLQRGLVRPPLFIPEFLDRPDVRKRIERAREASFADIFDVE